MTTPRNDYCHRMVLEVYFEGAEGQRIAQRFEFRAANQRITVKPVEDHSTGGPDPHLRLSYNEGSGFKSGDVRSEPKQRDVEGPDCARNGEPMRPVPRSTRPFDLSREVSMAAPGCTRSRCITCLDSRVAKPGGSRGTSSANLVRQRGEDEGNASSSGTNEELSSAREDAVSEWLANQLCLTRMKLKVILAFKKLVEKKNSERREPSTSQALPADPSSSGRPQ